MDVKLPKLGEGSDSGVVVTILVKEGDQITKGQTIIELENEKAVAPIPSTTSGTVAKIRVKEGDKTTNPMAPISIHYGIRPHPPAQNPAGRSRLMPEL